MYPTYAINSTKCTPSGNATTFTYTDSLSNIVAWIGHDADSGKIKAAPQRADYKLHSQSTYTVTMTASDSAT